MCAEIYEGTTMPQRPIFLLPPVLALPFLLSGCLTNPTQPSIDPTPFETLEYQGQQGLAVINASALYARGGTGQGVAVALVDSGLNSNLPEFQGRIADPGFDYVENRAGTFDRVGHGTQMAGILAANKDDQGMHGVAFNAQLNPFVSATTTSHFSSTPRLHNPGRPASTKVRAFSTTRGPMPFRRQRSMRRVTSRSCRSRW
ncbi:hypothetical protein EMIT0P171_150032 [Pseudomonas sp. IT-P171]